MPAERGADPHLGLAPLEAGEPLERASGAVVLLHGRGASPEDILFSCRSLALPGFALLAPRAGGGTWYPNRFTEPLASNEPWLSSALRAVGGLLGRVEARLPAARTVLLGFSQGACLALEFAARHPRRYGAVVGL
ncbi:MAG: alpha/beta hydrolase, partial [Candidatus Dormibacterales bacterium]